MKPYWCPVNSCWVPSGTLQIWAPTKINLGFAAQKTKNAYFLPLSTAPVPCKSQIISNIDDRSELVLSMRCCSQLVRSSWLLFPTSAQLVGNGFAGLSLVPWTSVIQNGRRILEPKWHHPLQPIPRYYPYHTESVWYGCRLGLAWVEKWGSLVKALP